MNRMWIPFFCVALVGVGAPAFADDAPSDQPNKTDHKLMKHCMAQHKAKHDGTSAEDMKKACQNEIKSYHNHPSAPTPGTAPP